MWEYLFGFFSPLKCSIFNSSQTDIKDPIVPLKQWQLITRHSTASGSVWRFNLSISSTETFRLVILRRKTQVPFFFCCIVSLNWSEEIQTMKNNLSNKSLEAVTKNIQTLLPFYTCRYFGVSTASHLFSCTNHFLFLFFCIGDSLNR